MAVKLQDLALSIKRIQHRHHRTLDIRMAPFGITLVQWDALRHISLNPDSSAHDLAQLTFQTDQSFGTLATRMIERNLIEREAGPGRALRHRLTASGEKLLKAGHAVMSEVLEQSFAGLNAAEREVLFGFVTRILETPLPAKAAVPARLANDQPASAKPKRTKATHSRRARE